MPRYYTMKSLDDLLEGKTPEVYFGAAHEEACQQLASLLNGIRPDKGDRLVDALQAPRANVRRYDAGVKFLKDNYYDIYKLFLDE